MKYLFACICFALVAFISARSYAPAPAQSYGSAPASSYGQNVAYQAIPIVVQAPAAAPSYAQPIVIPLIGAPSNPIAGASAAAASAALNAGIYQQLAVPSYDLFSGVADSYGGNAYGAPAPAQASGY